MSSYVLNNNHQVTEAEDENPVTVYNKAKTAGPNDWIKDSEKQGSFHTPPSPVFICIFLYTSSRAQ